MSKPPIYMTIDKSDIQKIKRTLKGIKEAIPKVTQLAVNRTLSGVRTDTTNEVAKVVALKKKTIRATITVKKLGRNNATAYVRCRGSRVPLMAFGARELKSGKGVSVKVLKEEGRKIVKHAFIAKMSSGHEGVFWRKYEGPRKKWNKKFPYSKIPKQYRLPIVELFSFAIPDVMGNEPTMAEIMRLAGIRLKKEVDRALNYELSKLKSSTLILTEPALLMKTEPLGL
ncbi:conserved hypothetical protein [delta proteobacterium NaphS2]|nr:conserved hypothetical protein [delta proteobacterium NaphS2]